MTGVLPSPISFTNNEASITITVQNTGNVPLNVTAFNASANFIFTPSDALPVEIATGASRGFAGALNYTGAGNPPSDVTLRVFANTSASVCGGVANASANASITVLIAQKGDLTPRIYPEKFAMNQEESSYANVTVHNEGPGDVPASELSVRIMHCTAPNFDDCPKISNPVTYAIDPLASRASQTISTDDYMCRGYGYIGIRATANSDSAVSEDPSNNNDTEFISCSLESCEISGPSEIRLPDFYTFSATCYDSKNEEVECNNMLDSTGFTWTYSPASGSTLEYLYLGTDGSANENMTLQVLNILANGTLTVDARGIVRAFNNQIKCTYGAPVFANLCIVHI